jgi:uncharacterized membrane protein YkoI
MTLLNTLAITGGLAFFSLVSGTSAFAETTTEDPMAESQAFLASKTSMAEATVIAETAAGGKVSSIEYQMGENGAPDMIMADVTLEDGSEKTIAINPNDGKVLKIAMADDENGDETQDGGDTETGENANN